MEMNIVFQSDIVDVNQIFKDLALMVHEQGEMVDSIESNIEHAQISVEEGHSNVVKAHNYQVDLSFLFPKQNKSISHVLLFFCSSF